MKLSEMMIIFILINSLITCKGNDLYQNFLDKEEEFFENDWSEQDNDESINYNVYRRDLPHAKYYNEGNDQQPLGISNALETNKRQQQQQSDNDLSNRFINNTSNDAKAPKMSNLLAPMENNNNNNNDLSENTRVKQTLEQILEELELIKASKMCSDSKPDGMDCDLNGVWNAAEIGLNIELSTNDNKLHVNLTEKNRKMKPTYRIDANWKCSGALVHNIGGPFYFYCTNHPLQSMTIFHGICKRCSGFDTIFGEWIFQHVPKDCRQLLTFSESKRDVFYKDVLHHGKDTSVIAHSNEVNMNKSNIKSTTEKMGISKSKVRRYSSNRLNEKLMQKRNRDLY